MKNKFLTFILLLSTALLTNCAKSDRNNNNNQSAYNTCGGMVGYVNNGYGSCVPSGSTGVVGQNCPTGYVSTMQYGCLPQGSCQPGFGMYSNGQCVQGTVGGYGTGYGTYCPVGQIKTAAGCVSQGSCPAGYGYAVGNYGGYYGAWCLPQTY